MIKKVCKFGEDGQGWYEIRAFKYGLNFEYAVVRFSDDGSPTILKLFAHGEEIIQDENSVPCGGCGIDCEYCVCGEEGEDEEQ